MCHLCLQLHSFTVLISSHPLKLGCVVTSTRWQLWVRNKVVYDTLSHYHSVASLSIFYLYFHADCSSELAKCMPRFTRLSTSSHPYSVHLPNARVYQYLHSFILYIGKLWNSLALSIFPPAYDLNSFKRRVSRHLSH